MQKMQKTFFETHAGWVDTDFISTIEKAINLPRNRVAHLRWVQNVNGVKELHFTGKKLSLPANLFLEEERHELTINDKNTHCWVRIVKD